MPDTLQPWNKETMENDSTFSGGNFGRNQRVFKSQLAHAELEAEQSNVGKKGKRQKTDKIEAYLKLGPTRQGYNTALKGAVNLGA